MQENTGDGNACGGIEPCRTEQTAFCSGPSQPTMQRQPKDWRATEAASCGALCAEVVMKMRREKRICSLTCMAVRERLREGKSEGGMSSRAARQLTVCSSGLRPSLQHWRLHHRGTRAADKGRETQKKKSLFSSPKMFPLFSLTPPPPPPPSLFPSLTAHLPPPYSCPQTRCKVIEL